MTEPRRLALSWSQVRAHEECKQKSYLLRTGHRSPALNIRGFFHGMVADSVMMAWLADPERAIGGMETMVEDMISTSERKAADSGDGIVRWRGPHDRQELRTFCVELVRRLEPILRELVLPYPYDAAMRFRVGVTIPYLNGEPTTIDLIGEMDLLTRPPGQIVIWDLKGTKDDSYYRKVIGQLIFYDLAAYALYGARSDKAGLIQPMCKTPVLEFVFSDDDRRAMWARILRLAHDIWNDDAACTTNTSNCPRCDVSHACVRFKPTGNTVSLGAALRQAAGST